MVKRKVTKNLESRLASLRDELLTELREQLEQCRVSSTHHPVELMDIASHGEADEMAARLAEADATKIEEIEDTLQRLREGTYGICSECGDPIPRRRLEVMPFATLCVGCKQREERKGPSGAQRPTTSTPGEFPVEEADDEPTLEDDVMRNMESSEAAE